MTYQLIAGERRLQAARMAGLARMPVVVREAVGKELLEIALVENLQREDLNPLEEAQAFRGLNEEFGLTQEQIAARVGRSRVAVANTLRLLSLEDDIRASLASGQITEGHARALLGIDDSRTRLDTWRRIVAGGMTVREAEEIARALKSINRPSAKIDRRSVKKADPHVTALEAELRQAIGMPVAIKKRRTGGSVVIRFHSEDELLGIITRIAR
jgi:ParB family chromosome partitioning protein